MLWFKNEGTLVTSLALANVSTEAATVAVTIRDESGQVIGTDTIELKAHAHTSFATRERLKPTAGRCGTVEFATEASGQLSVLGLRFNPGVFTSIPVQSSR